MVHSLHSIYRYHSDHPLLAITVLSGIISTFKSYPTLGDTSLWLGLLACLPDIWPGKPLQHAPMHPRYRAGWVLTHRSLRRIRTDLRHPLLSVALQLYSVILLPILHSLWLESGTGNANFFYAATLVYCLGCGMAVVDVLGAGLRQQAARKVIDAGILDVGDPNDNEAKIREADEVESAKAILEKHDLVIVQYAGLGS